MKPNSVYIIAEAGVNHNGDMNIARQLIDAAAKAGANAVKFQTFKAKEIVTAQAQKAAYQKQTTEEAESQFDMLRKLELDVTAHQMLMEHSRQQGISFLSTPFDADSLDMLLEMGIETIKIPSGEITNLPYLRKAGAKRKKIILSTGMATLQEIEETLLVLETAGTPRRDITLLHCNTQYPTPFSDANLAAMQTLTLTFPDCPIGYSDHTQGIACPIAATALGATVIEKHFTLDKTMKGPDHSASIDPSELTAMVSGIREIEQALGSGIKQPSPSEIANIAIARRFLVASHPIAKGETLTASNIAAKRTGNGGISPMQWDFVIGKTAPKAFEAGEQISL